MRILAWFFALFYVINGVVMIVAPGWWYGATPGVRDSGPFNPHFIIDVGIAFAGSGALIGCGTNGAGWRVLLAGAVFPVGHALFHIVELLTGEAGGPLLVHVFGVILPAFLTLWTAWSLKAKEA